MIPKSQQAVAAFPTAEVCHFRNPSEHSQFHNLTLKPKLPFFLPPDPNIQSSTSMEMSKLSPQKFRLQDNMEIPRGYLILLQMKRSIDEICRALNYICHFRTEKRCRNPV